MIRLLSQWLSWCNTLLLSCLFVPQVAARRKLVRLRPVRLACSSTPIHSPPGPAQLFLDIKKASCLQLLLLCLLAASRRGSQVKVFWRLRVERSIWLLLGITEQLGASPSESGLVDGPGATAATSSVRMCLYSTNE